MEMCCQKSQGAFSSCCVHGILLVLWKGSLKVCFIFSCVLVTRLEPSCRVCIEPPCTCQCRAIYQVLLTSLYLYFRAKSCKQVGGINQITQLWAALSHGCQRWVPSSIILRNEEAFEGEGGLWLETSTETMKGRDVCLEINSLYQKSSPYHLLPA